MGHRFLKHLSRTSVLWHVVDISEPEENIIIENIRVIESELGKYDVELLRKPRWLVFNKMDALPAEEAQARVDRIVKAIHWSHPFFLVSAIAKQGTPVLCQETMQLLRACHQISS